MFHSGKEQKLLKNQHNFLQEKKAANIFLSLLHFRYYARAMSNNPEADTVTTPILQM
jgi:hypothetical protein